MTKEILQWATRNKIHLIGWFLFIICEIVLIGFAAGRFGKPIAYLLHYALNIVLFYSNTFLVLKNGFSKRKWRITIISSYLILEIALFIALKISIDAILIGHQSGVQLFSFVDLPYLLQNLWRGLLFIGLSCYYFMFLRYKKERMEKEQSQKQEHEGYKRNKELEIALHQSTNAYLKAQINPHFIFNTLGFIHDSVLRTDAQAAQAVIDLSELMRFAVNSGHTDQDPFLLEEIQQVESLIRLYKLRFKERVFVEFTHSTAAGESRLIPLILLTLVENLFKHGDIHKSDDPAKIAITTNDGTLKIYTYNLKKEGKTPQGFHNGMANVSTRLEYNYTGRFKMHYGEIDGKHFFVEITLSTQAET